MVRFNYDGNSIYLDKGLKYIVDLKLKEVKDDGDLIGVITAGEGFGKSLFVRQLGAYIAKKMNTEFTIDNIHFSTEELINKAEDSPKYTVHVLDESRADLYRGSSNSKQNKKFTHWVSECRSKNLIILLCLPSPHDLDNYIMKWRCGLWVNINKLFNKKTKLHERGYFNVMGVRKRKVFLKYLKEKYSTIPNNLKILSGRFFKDDPIDKKVYENKKDSKRKEKFIDNEAKEKTMIIPERIIPLIANQKPSVFAKPDTKEWEMVRKWLYSLRKSGKLETGLNNI